MIDLHCHMLPGIDDGASDLDTALEMAGIAVADGITTTACTPHIYPALYENTGVQIIWQVEAFRAELQDADIPLEVTYGADIQLVLEMLSGLQSGRMPTLHGTTYFLFEPPHHTVPAGLAHLIAEGREAAERWVGADEADLLVTGLTRAVLENREPADIPPPPALDPQKRATKEDNTEKGWFGQLFSGH